MKSANVCLPGAGENLQITPNGLLNAINTSIEAALDEVRRHRGARHAPDRAVPVPATAAIAITGRGARLEPLAHIGVEADAVHEVVQRLAQPRSEVVVIGARGIVEGEVVVCEADVRRRLEGDAVFVRREPDG